jgi:hypothetical protein
MLAANLSLCPCPPSSEYTTSLHTHILPHLLNPDHPNVKPFEFIILRRARYSRVIEVDRS